MNTGEANGAGATGRIGRGGQGSGQEHEARRDGVSEAALAAFLDQDLQRFFYRWGGRLSSVLVRIRSRFGGDLDLYLIYLVFLLAELSQGIARADAEARGQRPRREGPRGMNALSLADITRIPRESARRKLQLLVAADYLRREEDGLYYLGDGYGLDAFFQDLRPLFWDGLLPPARAQPDVGGRAA